MSEFFSVYDYLFAAILIHAIIAYSQYVVFRAGVFSIASAGFVSLGAYAAGLAVISLGLGTILALMIAALVGLVAGLLIALPLSRVRGIFQAVATLAFVQIVISVFLYSERITGGAFGLNNIPATVKPVHLIFITAVLLYLMWAMNRYSVGRAFDAVRQDETAAVALGVSVYRYHALAFALSGCLGGFAGGLYALHSYSIVPGQFGFEMVVAALTAVVLGGRSSVAGPLVGTIALMALPELVRGLDELRYLVHGTILVAVMIFMPLGVVDTLKQLALRYWRRIVP